MKNSLKNSKLWQQKRNELKVNANPDQDWADMNSLLDQHLPVSPPKGNLPGSGASGLAKLGGIAGLSVTIIAVTVYLVAHFSGNKGDKVNRDSNKIKQQTELRGKHDSLTTANESVSNYNNADSNALATKGADRSNPSLTNGSSATLSNSKSGVKPGSASGPTGNNNSVNNSTGKPGLSDPSKTHLGSGNKMGSKLGSGNTAGSKVNGIAASNSGRTNKLALSSRLTGTGNSKNNGMLSKSGIGVSSTSLINGGAGHRAPGRLTNNGSGLRSNSGHNSNVNPGQPNNGGGRNGIQPNGKSNVGNRANLNNTVLQNNLGSNPGKTQSGRGKDSLTTKLSNINNKDTTNNNTVQQFPAITQAGLISAGANTKLSNINNKDTTNNNTVQQFPAITQAGLISAGANKKDSTEIVSAFNPAKGKTNDKEQSKTKAKKDKKPKPSKTPSTGTSKFDYGILGGANTSNSFSLYAGAYGTYHINNKWGASAQVLGLTTQNISGGYSHANGSKVDSGKIIQVTDSRRAYFVHVPLHVTYNITDNFSLKAGPVLSIPVKQDNGVTSLTPTTINKDSTYFKKTTTQLAATKYDQQINFGLSGGVRYQYNRFSIEASYLKSLGGFNVTSDYGSYKATSAGMLNITIGVQLNRVKK